MHQTELDLLNKALRLRKRALTAYRRGDTDKASQLHYQAEELRMQRLHLEALRVQS
jgi:hypothetical protein